MMRTFISAAVIAASVLSANAGTKVLWESETPEGVQIDWGTMIHEAVITPEQCADYKVGDKVLVTVAHYDTTLDAWPQVRLTSPVDGWPVVCAAQVLNDKEEPAVITFEIDEDVLEVMQEEGYFPSGNACWLSKMELVTEGDEPEEPAAGNVLWKSENPEGVQIDWGTMIHEAVITPEQCANYKVGDKVLVTVAHYDTTLDAWPQVRLTSPVDGWPVICPAQVLNDMAEPAVITFEIDEDVLEVMQEEGFFPSGNACWLSKMELVTEGDEPEEPAAGNVLWKSENPEGILIDWGTMIHEAVIAPEQCVDYDYKVGDAIAVTVAHYDMSISDWPQVRITSPIDGWPVICAPQLLNDMPEPAVIKFEIDEDVLEVMQEEGFFPSGNACWLSKMEYISNSADGVENIELGESATTVNVYTIQGILVKKAVNAAEATCGLNPGMYIIGNKKVCIR